jgi:hypothetical protein
MSEETTPTRPRALASLVPAVALWGFGLLVAAGAALPLSTASGVFYGSHPYGDAPLADEGGLSLADLLLGRGAAAFSAVLPSVALVLVLGAIAAHVPTGALLSHLAGRGKTGLREAYTLGVHRFFSLFGVTILMLVASGLVGFGGAFASESLTGAIGTKLDDRALDLAGLVALLPFAGMLFTLRTVTDLASASLFTRDVGVFGALVHGVRTFRAHKGRALGTAFVAYATGTLLVVGITARFGLLGLRASAPLVLFFAHQGALLGKGLVRLRWLAESVHLTRVTPSPETRLEHALAQARVDTGEPDTSTTPAGAPSGSEIDEDDRASSAGSSSESGTKDAQAAEETERSAER